MKIYPAIDLIDGRVVRLFQGRYDARTDYAETPLSLALDYQDQGAELLHVVDLNAARDGGSTQLELITQLARSLKIPLQAGGGVRSVEDVQRRFDAGCQRVVVGSVAIRQPAQFCNWLQRFGAERLVVALDVRKSASGRWLPASHGWQEEQGIDLFELLDQFSGAGLRHVLCTDISRDGALAGANRALYHQLCQRYPQLHIQASGGVGEVDELSALAATGAAAVIIGKALLEGRFTLAQALQLLTKRPCYEEASSP